MDWIRIIQNSIDVIEKNLSRNIEIESLIENQYVSSYYFQKMFSSLCNCTVGEYIRNRRLTLAGVEVVDTEKSILDIALTYGYDSAEGFTRAFTKFHGMKPSIARKDHSDLKAFNRITVMKSLTGGKVMLGSLGERGYLVKEAGAVYYTNHMDETLQWFTDILGWYGQIEARDESGKGMYGCVNNIPMEIESLHLAPFTGIHLFYGEPLKRTVGFMLVDNVVKLHDFVKRNGWNNITEVIEQQWGGKSCSVTTIDDSILTFFEC